MRKLLLASAALLGASVGTMSLASAQTTNLPPTVIGPPLQGGVVSAPGGVSSANNNNNYQAAALPGGVATPVPGSVVVHMQGRIVFYGAAESSSLDKTAGTGAANTGGAKVSPYLTLQYARLYTGLDAMATNGMRYGAAIEIRTNNGAATGSTTNNQSSANTTTDTLYIRRGFGYIASGNAGILRFGVGDGPFGIFDNGITTQQSFDDGGWNGDLPAAIPGNSQPVFPFLSQQGAEYGSSKVVYLSPQLAGFDLGLSYAPNNAASSNGNCSIAGTGCYNLSSIADGSANQQARFTNAYVGALRYQGTFGPVGLLAYGGYMGSGAVSYQGPAEVGGAKVPTYNGLSLGQGGAEVTIGPISVGGNVQAGSYNGIGALQPKGGTKAVAWTGGIVYSNGPFTVGTSYFAFDSQGYPGLVDIAQRHETGYAAGMTYGLAPGLAIYVSYIYGTRHQGDFNFQTGGTGSAYNNVKGQAFGVGSLIKW